MSRGVFYPLELTKGETLEFKFDVVNMGENVDPSDVSISGSFKKSDTVNPLQFSITEDDEDPYTWVVSYSASNSNNLTPDVYRWEIRMTETSTSKVTTLFNGTLTVIENVVTPTQPQVLQQEWVNA